MREKSEKTRIFAKNNDYFAQNMRKIDEILAIGDGRQIYSLLTNRKRPFKVPFKISEEQYNPDGHRIFDEKYRPKKSISVPSGRKDPITGQPMYKTKKVERVRIALPLQRLIVDRNTGFLVGNKVEYKMTVYGEAIKQPTDKQTRLFNATKRVFHKNKMMYFDRRLVRGVKRAREAAELWYMETTADGHVDPTGWIRVKLLSPVLGDKLYPHFDDNDRMDGFARQYKVWDESGTAVNHFDVYTDTLVYQYIDDGTDWKLQGEPKLHGFTKTPVVYYRQEESDWENVQWAIERVEDCLSNWGDSNDYFGTPKYFIKGKLKGFAEKAEQGAVFEGDKDTQMNVLSWDNSPQSVTGEISELMSLIFSCTRCADISFERMKEVGNNTSGAAIRLMLIDPHMNASEATEMFGEMFTRRCNIVMNGICNTGIVESGIPMSVADDMELTPVFTPFMPKNDAETLQMLSTSTGGASSTSRKRAIELNPLNDDPQRIGQEMQEEQQQALAMQAQAMGVGGTSQSQQSTESEENNE